MADKREKAGGLVTVELPSGEQVEMGEAEVEQYLADHPGAHVVEEEDEEGASEARTQPNGDQGSRAGYVVRNFREYGRRYHAVARTTLEAQAAITEQRMKDERRWTDRTGEARRNLRCRVYDSGKALRFAASQGVPYGVFLEHAHQGAFAILQPTVRSQWPIALRAVAEAVKGIRL